jgi:hypothetical protein
MIGILRNPRRLEGYDVQWTPPGAYACPACACGCGEGVPVGLHAERIAELSGRVWYLPGHGANGKRHERPYADAPGALR